VPAELFIILIALVGFWLIVMRPTRQQQRRVAQLQAELAVGDEVIISAGIFATVVALEDDRVRLEIAPGTVVAAARQVVVRRAPEPEAHEPDEKRDDTRGPADSTPDSSTDED
jgi:preprotein translocase subunit YajC